MAALTKIEWSEVSWNPVTGCTKTSNGCSHCYAERLAIRLKAMGQRRYAHGFSVTLHKDLVTYPLTLKTPKMIFVNSMSDLFHENVPLDFIQKIFGTMNQCPQHTFQILTKRSGRMVELAGKLTWTPNIWMGVTVEQEMYVERIRDLAKVPAAVRFLSCEPLLGNIRDLPLENIHWVIVGGESGPGARPMEKEWVENIHSQCTQARVPFFFKQWGGTRKKKAGRELNSRIFSEMPQVATLG